MMILTLKVKSIYKNRYFLSNTLSQSHSSITSKRLSSISTLET